MDTKLLTRMEIFQRIEEKKITAEEGLQLLKTAYPPSPDSSFTLKTYSFHWERQDLPPARTLDTSSYFLLFGLDDKLRDYIAASQGIDPSRMIFVGQGKSYRQADERTFFIDPSNPQDYRLLLEFLVQHDRVPSHIVHHWSAEPWSFQEEVITRQLETGFYSLLYLSQSMMRLKIRQKVNVLYMYDSKQGVEPLHGAISGFAKTIGRENPGYMYRVIDLGGGKSLESLARIVLQEWGSQEEPAEVKYDGGPRYIKGYEEVSLPLFQEPATGFRVNGTYMITGGTGGIGMIFARYLARQYNANLILVGSSPLNEEKSKAVEELQHLGGKALYIRADLGQKGDTARLMTEARNHFGRINGILHAAGMIKDALLIGKEKPDAAKVLAPKIYGSVFLAEGVRNDPPEFIMLFSGLAAVLGNVGQADYAFANAFLDQFAVLLQEELPQTNVVSVNWPLWEHGGMTIDSQIKEQLAQSTGIVAISDEDGIATAVRVLQAPFSQVVAVPMDTQIKATPLFRTSGNAEAYRSTDTRLPDDEGYAAVEAYIKQILSRQLKLSPAHIQSGEPLDKYGIDSMSIVRMTREMEKDFGELSKTLFFEYQTVKELAEYFVDQHGDVIMTKLLGKEKAASGQAVSPPALSEIKAKPAEKSRFRSQASPGPDPALHIGSSGNNQPQAPVSQDVAIIGISGRYPLARNLDEYWDNLTKGRDCITEIPPERWDYREHYTTERGIKDKIYSKWGGFIDDHDKFDPLFFGITPRDAEVMDPQERLFLEVVWQAMEDAGYNSSTLRAFEVGVYVGVMYGHYQLFGAEETVRGVMTALSSSYSSIANRISYTLDFRGPSLAVDSMCSSSLSTIHLACESIRSGECQVAVAGGVNLSIHPTKYQYLCANNFASSDGRCRSFGEGGNGYVPGEGVGAVLLKSVAQAKADGDHIYAVIKASAINHDGRTNGYTVPSPGRQSELIVKALKKAGVDPRAISYIEAHGTGTSLGDPIEITGLTKAFASYTPDKQFCPIGSVKSNIGHLEAAAGIAGITKIVLQMKHKQLVPSIHSDVVNANIKLEDTPFYIQKTCEEWKQPSIMIDGKATTYPRMAGISAFGAGGSNAHVILAEYIEDRPAEINANGGPKLIVLSARNKEQLKKYAERLWRYIQTADEQLAAYPEQAGQRLQWVQGVIGQWVSELIQVEARDVDLDSTLSDLNLDMQAIFTLIHQINTTWDTCLAVEDTWNHSSIRHLASCLCDQYERLMEEAYSKANGRKYPQQPSSGIDLEAVAYTLHMGREEKDERLALVVSDVAELRRSLESFCQADGEHPQLYTGSIHKNHTGTRGEASREHIRTLVDAGAYHELAELWVSGANMDWNLLYTNGRPKRIPLPTYPFESKRYWYNSYAADQKSSRTSKNAAISREPSLPVPIPADQQERAFSGFSQPLQLEDAAGTYRGDEVFLRIIDDSIAIVTMQDKQNRNMFDKELLTGLMAKFAEIERNKKIKVVILTGYENIFSMGGTQGQLLDIADQKRSFTDAPFLYRGLLECSVPVIAAIQGHASGGGLLFGLYADMVVMAEEGIYSAVFMKYGFTPGMGATYILKEKLGYNLAVEMMHTAASFTGAELSQRGASVTFKKSGDVIKEALRIARLLTEKPLVALQTLKRELSARILQELPVYIERERLMHEETFTKPEVKERIQHFYLDDHAFDVKPPAESRENLPKTSKLKLAPLTETIQEEDRHEVVTAAAKGTAGGVDALLEALVDGRISPEEAVQWRRDLVSG